MSEIKEIDCEYNKQYFSLHCSSSEATAIKKLLEQIKGYAWNNRERYEDLNDDALHNMEDVFNDYLEHLLHVDDDVEKPTEKKAEEHADDKEETPSPNKKQKL